MLLIIHRSQYRVIDFIDNSSNMLCINFLFLQKFVFIDIVLFIGQLMSMCHGKELKKENKCILSGSKTT